jgi:hypothetical protein
MRERENAWMQEVQTLMMCEKENTLFKKKPRVVMVEGGNFFC